MPSTRFSCQTEVEGVLSAGREAGGVMQPLAKVWKQMQWSHSPQKGGSPAKAFFLADWKWLVIGWCHLKPLHVMAAGGNACRQTCAWERMRKGWRGEGQCSHWRSLSSVRIREEPGFYWGLIWVTVWVPTLAPAFIISVNLNNWTSVCLLSSCL